MPIDAVLPQVLEALARAPAVLLDAAPGAGKTTRVAPAVLDAPWLEGRRVVMLEPRRLAARMAAEFMASDLGEPCGQTVGYVVRAERRVSSATRLLVVTEGILTRMIQDDPALTGVGLLIFDEFHERNLQSDLALALALDSQAALRQDLRLLLMSATMDTARAARFLNGAPVIVCPGHSFPVETRYLERDDPSQSMASRTVRGIAQILPDSQGHILAFLPGVGEIAAAAEALAASSLPPGTVVRPLHAGLPWPQQLAAVRPGPAGERRIILATSVAETSLTIDGVRTVVDSGFARLPAYRPATGMTALETVRVSRDAADQRRGRAGRQAPGLCLRLWSRAVDAGLAATRPPEILAVDLAALVLELAQWGVTDPEQLRWLDAPPAPAVAQARQLLQHLGALDDRGTITPHGRRLMAVGLAPRLAHLVVAGHAEGRGQLAAALAALLEERDILTPAPGEPRSCDVRLRLDLLRHCADSATHGPAGAAGASIHRGTLARVREHWRRAADAIGVAAPAPWPAEATEDAGRLIAQAYPERVCRRRQPGTPVFISAGGTGLRLADAADLAQERFLAVAQTDGQADNARVFLAAPIAEADIEALFANRIEWREAVEWDDARAGVVARRIRWLDRLPLREEPLPQPSPEAVARALLDGIRQRGIECLPWSDACRDLVLRVRFLASLEETPGMWPDFSDDALMAGLEHWLLPRLVGCRRLDDLRRLDLVRILAACLSAENRHRLEREAPTHLTVPSGSRIRVDYADATAPVLAVRLQELFGLLETPRIANGRVPITFHILSPAMRPVQVTRDLASFWRQGYPHVRKELRGRYPKHLWPEDPFSVPATRRVERKRLSSPTR